MKPAADDHPPAARERLGEDLSVAFDRLPPQMVVRAFGVDYGHLRPPEGGDLFVTRLGWPYARQLLPASWYADRHYSCHGERLQASTGHVYRVTSRPCEGRTLDLVVKFSRVAQDVPLVVETTFPDDVPPEVIAGARFNSPMEEFGLVMELRENLFGPRHPRVMTQVPLAIFVPPEELELWELGRTTSKFLAHSRLLAKDQEDAVKAIELDIKRQYVLVYQWIKGSDAQDCFEAGALREREFRELTPRIVRELREKGFRVLDNKPRHFILRTRRRDRRLLRHGDGRLAYGLVDFELLQRTREYQRQFKARRREKYWQSRTRARPAASALPSHLERMTVFGVDYLYGHAPDGGRLWVVGEDQELFDYFLPERWLRTERVKLSSENEVHRTCTRDNIHVVYRRSRVGARPRVDPLVARGSTIREHGYNSPFEEVAIAERLREMGISTTFPRAVFRTGHHSMKATHLKDGSRFDTHASLTTPGPDPEPVLTPNHDYYTVWGYYRGVAPSTEGQGGVSGVVDLERALDEGLLTREEHRRLVAETLLRLNAIGLTGDTLDENEFVVLPDEDGRLRRTSDGKVEVLTVIDALTAYEFRLLDDRTYQSVVDRMGEKLRAVDCEDLNPAGKHLLLVMSPDGTLRTDRSGHPVMTLCNFELIRGLYRPIR